MNNYFSKMRFAYISLIFFILTSPIYACPMCAGTPRYKDRFTVYLLGVFILLTYIPYTIIYRLTKKYKHLEEKSGDK